MLYIDSYRESINQIIGYIPSDEVCKNWLLQLGKQWNCSLFLLHQSLTMKENGDSVACIGPICYGDTFEEAALNMLEGFLRYKYIKIVNGEAIAILFC
jgi:hypothetical protein